MKRTGPKRSAEEGEKGCAPQKFLSVSRCDYLEPVLMMESADNGRASNGMSRRNTVPMSALLRERTRCRRDSRAQAHVRSGVVEMCNPGIQDQLKMLLVKWNKEVEAFAAQRSAEAFAE